MSLMERVIHKGRGLPSKVTPGKRNWEARRSEVILF